MIGQDFIDRIEELRHNTYSNINELQTNLCPMVKNIYLNYQFEYWYDGYKYNLWEDDTHIYAVNEIPYCYDNDIKNTVFRDTLINLVEQDKVWPFLLFINGAVIKWSNIEIIHDYDYSYMRINNIASDESISATIVYFPVAHGKLRYGEDSDITLDPNTKGLYFDSEGKFLRNPEFEDISLRLEIFDDDIYFNKVHLEDLTEGVLEFTNLPDGYLPNEKNVILFGEDGLLKPSENIFSQELNGAYCMIRLPKNISTLNIHTAIIMYNTSHSKSKSYLYHRSEDIDREALKNNLLTHDAIDDEELWESVYRKILNPFDFEYTFGTDYNTNSSQAAKYITQYDYSLWNKIWIDECPIKSFQYTGLEFKKLADDKGYVHFSRKHTDLIEDVAMMFLNSKVYANSIDISYTTNTINLPIFGILDDDHVEIVLFTKCNNNILDIKVPDPQTAVYIHPEYNLNDCYIMSEECEVASYDDVPDSPEHRKQYICEVQSYTVDDNYNYHITFVQPEYYGKDLKIVPKNQFRYYRFTQRAGEFKFILPTIFNYCHDISRYMVFVNGKKIDKTEFTITIMNQYRPFDKLVLYLSTILDPDDYIDVFYLPESLEEKYKEDSISVKGYLSLLEPNNYPKLYSFSKYTNMIFINGLKVNPLDIKDVSMNSMIINTDLRNIDNVTVMEYLTGSDEVARFLNGMDGIQGLMGDTNYPDDPKDLHEIEGAIERTDGTEDDSYSLAYNDLDFTKTVWDNWKDIITQLIVEHPGEDGYEGLSWIYGKFKEVVDKEKNYKEDYAQLRSILYDVVVDYYLQREGARTGAPFVYDFEMQEWFPNELNPDNLPDGWTYYVDPEGKYYCSPDNELYVSYYTENLQTKVISLYPDHDKLLDYIPTDDIATTQEVKSGKKFISAQ